MQRTDRALASWAYADVPAEAARTEARESAALARKAPRRYEVATAQGVVMITATRAAAFRRARMLARFEEIAMFVTDLRARVCAQAVWRFRSDGTLGAIVVRAMEWPRQGAVQ